MHSSAEAYYEAINSKKPLDNIDKEFLLKI